MARYFALILNLLLIGSMSTRAEALPVAVIEADDEASAAGKAEIIDHAFVKQHTTGFEAFI
ncbi:hypothetical protein SAMN05444581_1308 [Methylocapsa palsarum]|uniref:Uncharacterized protein n=1 Tax=Methylocapsa palsarum TaxID=1612308 RepID=A0A1I4CWU1_9HYPH|nr:hypothetical protein SAMN05444581_1308 [Methylocapsa palsarum]